jgi:hypothetical protein
VRRMAFLGDRKASTCSLDELADLDTEREKVADWIGGRDRKADGGQRGSRTHWQCPRHTLSNISRFDMFFAVGS